VSASTSARAAVGATAGRFFAVLPRRSDLASITQTPRTDIVAGLTVAVVALPLALGFGVSSGMGAAAGITTAIVAGLIAAAFGGSNLQVSGPTGAMTVVLVPIFSEYGADGVLVTGLMAGAILVGLALIRAGRYMRYIPLPVIEGFTIGIAAIIALQQVPNLLGTSAHGEHVVAVAWRSVEQWISGPDWAPLLLAVLVAATMLCGARFKPAIPFSLIAVAAITVVTSLYDLPVATIGEIPIGLPGPSLPSVSPDILAALIVPACAVAALGALESLLSASVADAMTVGQRHDSDRELFGQGLANLASPLFGGMPATAAIARTAVNVRAGARSRLAAGTHAVALLVVVLVASAFVSEIPLAALAGVLIATAIQMIEVSSLRAVLHATRGDAAVLVLTATATLALDLVTAVVIGIVAAGIFALVQLARSASLDQVPLDHANHTLEEQHLLDEHIVAYRLDGPLFFGAAHNFLLELTEISDIKAVILRCSRITNLDATGASVLADTIKRLEHRHITVLLSGIKPHHDNVFAKLGVYDELRHQRHVFETTPEAIAHAHLHLVRATQDH
jgi:MFS superfamily sulfate permease-like transporter